MAEEEVQEVEETPEETPVEDDEPSGTKYTQFSTPQEEARFKRIYAHMKLNERALDELGKTNRVLADRLREMEEGQKQFWAAATLEGLQKAKIAALDEGNHARVAQIDEKLAEYRQRPAPQNTEPERGLDYASQLALADWVYETDAQGNHLRPWADESHPDHQKCLTTAQIILNDPANEGRPVQDILPLIDRAMNGTSRSATKPTVLSGNTKREAPKGNQVKMTPEEERAARAMGFEPAEYIKLHKKWSRANA